MYYENFAGNFAFTLGLENKRSKIIIVFKSNLQLGYGWEITEEWTVGIDFAQAKRAFEEYLDEYDREDDKIRLKIVHTYCVADCARKIARGMNLSPEDTELAEVIGLLHDIGRFEQVRQFDSFMPDTMDHAAYGAQLLFGEKKMIRRFLAEEGYDEIICKSIEKHSDFRLEGIQDERTLLHARLIRDADKLDNCRVKLEASMETLLGVDEIQAGKGEISPKVWKACAEHKPVLSSDRKSFPDHWVSYVAQIFDVNFAVTFSIIKEKNYIQRIVDRLPYESHETAEKMKRLAEIAEEYIDNFIEKNKFQEQL